MGTNGLAAAIFTSFWTYGVATAEAVTICLSFFLGSHDLALLFVPMIGYWNSLVGQLLPVIFALLWALNTEAGPSCVLSTTNTTCSATTSFIGNIWPGGATHNTLWLIIGPIHWIVSGGIHFMWSK